MKIKFLVDCIGRETAMKQYGSGEIADFPTAQALELIKIGMAEEFDVVAAFENKPKRKLKEAEYGTDT